MYHKIDTIIQSFSYNHIPGERKEILNQLINYIRLKKSNNGPIRLNFICTHNSRRSHLSQIWAQTMAYHYSIDNVYCYSGGTEATAMFPKVAETLTNQGFEIYRLSDFPNPVYAVKYDQNEHPIICFSKEYNHAFNPQAGYAAIVTCNSADEACPVVLGADARFPIKYDDPKAFDGTDLMDAKYAERSLQIGAEMAYVFGNV
ncbi:MAG TPA: protein-tyrosine-phosphatase [Saprospiraceae bacterium]|nr:protein-tyrosine-phosphatase [Saprospiraceae bacterium]